MKKLPAPSAWRYTHHIPDGAISYQYDTAKPKNCNHPNYTPMFTQGQLNQYGQQCRAVALETAAELCNVEQWRNEGKVSADYIKAFNEGCVDCEQAIRRLK